MTRWSVVIYCMLLASSVYAQEKKTSKLPDAERAFARYASTHTVKQAFLHFLDSAGLVFNRGTAMNGLASWQKQPDNNFRLVWYPVHYAVSGDNSLGFTTGPYEAGNGTNAGFGNFTSVWKKDAANEWKLLIDLGTSYNTSLYDTISPTSLSFASLTPTLTNDTSVMEIEQAFITAFETKGVDAYRNVITNGTWLNTDKQHPAHTADQINMQLSSLKPSMKFIPTNGTIAKSHDLAYVYGTIMYEHGKENYLRIWAHTKDGWKLLCQVIKIVD